MKINKLIDIAKQIAKKRKLRVYVVGGYVRDQLLKKTCLKDIDFIVFGNAVNFAKDFSRKTKGSFVHLSDVFQIARVVINKEITCDFSKGRGKNISDDLKERDFTINALALDINNDKNTGIIDEFNGLKDLKNGIVREINKSIYRKDPLRLLRAVRFSAMPGFKIDNKTKVNLKEYANLISKPAKERVRDEFFKILSGHNSFVHIKLLDEAGILKKIFPELKIMEKVSQPGFHHLDVWNHSMETLKQLENILEKPGLEISKEIKESINNHLNERSAQSDRLTLLKFICLFHDIGKPKTKTTDKKGNVHFYYHESVGAEIFAKAAKKLRLSNNEIKTGKLIIKNHLRTGYLSGVKEITKKAVYKFLRDCGENTIEVLLISLADRLSARGIKVNNKTIKIHKNIIEKLMKEYYKVSVAKPMPVLINGHDIMKEFNLLPSPLIGDLLEKVKEAQALKKISTKEEALDLLKRVMIP